MSIEAWRVIQFAGIILGAGIAGISQYQIAILERREKREAAARTATSGTLEVPVTPTPNNANQLFTVDFGTNFISVDLATLQEGYELKPGLAAVGLNVDALVTIKLKNDSIKVSGRFKSLDGKAVADIIDNEWEVNSSNFFKRNYNKHALEIIDGHGLKFQIEYHSNQLIEIKGIFKSGDKYLKVTRDTGIVTYDEVDMNLQKLEKLSDEVPNIFRYPASKYLGVRVTPKL
jgi:hypothetical protein